MPYTFKHGDRPLDDFCVQRAVGSGGFGEVYYAISDGGREVALKYLKANPQVELRGVSHCINLKSPHLVSIFDVKKNEDGEYIIIMEYCSGPSLRDLLIAEPNGFGPQKAAFFLREIAKGLSYLHDRGIVHRDMKPGNIFYDDGYVKIGDYGLSKFISVSRHSAQTASIGTVHYMAPEIGSGNYSKGVDVYALGVILYEMLLGKVPFEGSTMAEVLMKHLTTQPEVEGLPEPFGKIIRKALEKDPKDRYQTVDEMVDELLGVEEVQQSLAGFSTKSLEGAVRVGGADRAESPVPSPNPVGRPGPGVGRGAFGRGRPPISPLDARAVELPDHLAKRVRRVSHKVGKKMRKLAGRAGRPAPPPVPPYATGRAHVGPAPGALPTLAEGKRRRQVLFTIMLTVGMAMALGVTVANVVKADIPADIGASTGLLTAAMVGALFLSRWAVGWFGLVYGKNMSSRLIHTGCCAPLLAIGAAPMLESQYYHDEGLSIWLGLVAVAVFANWQKTFDQAARSEMRFGGALWKALGALAMTGLAFAIITNDDVPDSPPPLLFASGGVALAAAIILQSASWLRPGTTARRRAGAVAAASPPNGVEDRYVDRDAGEATPAGDYPSGDLPFALPVGRSMPPAGHITATTDHAADVRHAFTRWGVTRAFWGVAAFVFMGGAIVTLLIAAILGHHDLNYGERTGVIVGGIACCAAMLFAVRKTTPIKREGFWQESIRPLLMCVSLFGMGATITGMARNWRWLSDDQQAFIVVGLIVSSLLFLASVLLCGRRRAEPKPFYNPPTGSGDVAGAGTPDTDETSSEDAGRNE